LDVKSEHEHNFTGWDGHLHRNAQLAFLSWLLHDPTAPPRRYIKHLIFRHDGQFGDAHLCWHGQGEVSEPAEWMIGLLTIRSSSDAIQLYRAGMRPQRTYHIRYPPRDIGIRIPPLEAFARVVRGVQQNSFGSHTQFWAGKLDDVMDDTSGNTQYTTQHRMVRWEIDPMTDSVVAPMDDSAQRLTVQLVDGDLLQRKPDMLRDGLVMALTQSNSMQVILACDANYMIGNQTAAEFAHSVFNSLKPPSNQDRLRVSHAAVVPIVVKGDAFQALAQALRWGSDPWHEGVAV